MIQRAHIPKAGFKIYTYTVYIISRWFNDIFAAMTFDLQFI